MDDDKVFGALPYFPCSFLYCIACLFLCNIQLAAVSRSMSERDCQCPNAQLRGSTLYGGVLSLRNPVFATDFLFSEIYTWCRPFDRGLFVLHPFTQCVGRSSDQDCVMPVDERTRYTRFPCPTLRSSCST
jgi:hypothetical protein